MEESGIGKYALKWHEQTGLYYLPRGKMPTEFQRGAFLFTTKPRTLSTHLRASVVPCMVPRAERWQTHTKQEAGILQLRLGWVSSLPTQLNA